MAPSNRWLVFGGAIVVLVLLVLWMLSGRASRGEPIPDWDEPSCVVLLMDLQLDFTGPEARFSVDPEAIPELVTGVKALVERASSSCSIVRIHTAFPPEARVMNWFRNHAAIEGSPGTHADPQFGPVQEEIVWKHRPDGFRETRLDDLLRQRRVSHIVIAGVFAEVCVYWTARAAMNRGYRVTIASDAVAGGSPGQVHRALQDLKARGARVVPVAQAFPIDEK